MTIDKFQRTRVDYGEIRGHVGFVVELANGRKLPNRLQPKPSDFVPTVVGNGGIYDYTAYKLKSLRYRILTRDDRHTPVICLALDRCGLPGRRRRAGHSC
jgi:hypothetical protein